MRKATVRKYKAVKQSQRIVRSKKKIKKVRGTKKGEMEKKVNSMGFTTEVNKKISEVMVDEKQMADIYAAPVIRITEEMDLETGEITKIVRKQQKLNEDQKAAIEKLEKKHKGDFRKMQMDNKVNQFVWSSGQCQKMHERYLNQFGTFP